MEKIPKILFLSRGRATRSQMAEGLSHALAGDRFVPFSAGTESALVDPLASEVMFEAGIDISKRKPRELADVIKNTFQYVVALSDATRTRYPLFPFTPRLLKWSVPDPEVVATEPAEKRELFRQVREQMRREVEELMAVIPESAFAGTRPKAA